MAYDDSEALQPNSAYSLGGYTFELKVQTVHEPGEEDVVSVFAICRSPDGTRETVPMDFPAGTTVESWTVEANETEASVYATIKGGGINAVTVNCTTPIPGTPSIKYDPNVVIGSIISDNNTYPLYFGLSGDGSASITRYGDELYAAHISGSRGSIMYPYPHSPEYWYWVSTTAFTGENGRYVRVFRANERINISLVPESDVDPSGQPITPTVKDGEYLIARFAIDLSEADGGPDGDWDEPGSDGPFSDQIYVEVTGASAGTHSASNIPQEAPEQLTYGSGGIGGNGGGGGAGASTVIIYDFVSHKTSIDGPAENAIIREPGTGGPGGKGGKGGDGCILIFY